MNIFFSLSSIVFLRAKGNSQGDTITRFHDLTTELTEKDIALYKKNITILALTLCSLGVKTNFLFLAVSSRDHREKNLCSLWFVFFDGGLWISFLPELITISEMPSISSRRFNTALIP